MSLFLSLLQAALANPVSLAIGVEHRSISHPFLNIEYQLPDAVLYLKSDHLSWYKQSTKDDIQTWFILMGQGYRTQQTVQKFENGVIDLSESFQTSYLGFQLGQLRASERNIQFGGRIHSGYYWFGNYGKRIKEMTPQIRSQIDTLFQWCKEGHLIDSYLGSTVVFTNDLNLYPHAHFRWDYYGSRPVEPIWGFLMGTTQNFDTLSLTRVGGEQADYIPLLGADWGEFWVKDYVITRLGGRYEAEMKALRYQIGLRTDLAWLQEPEQDAEWKIGSGLSGLLLWEDWSLNSHIGYGFWQEAKRPSLSISLGWSPIVKPNQ